MDDLARWVASPVSRRGALKLGAGALAGLAIVPLRPRTAFAQGGYTVCSPETQFCFAFTCPAGTTCCPFPDDHLHHHYCPSGECCNPCDPSSSQCLGDGHCGPGPVAKHCACTRESGGVVCGGDCCRGELVCCDRIFTFNPPSCCTKKERDKGDCKDAKYGTEIAIAAIGVLAAISTGGLATGFVLVGGAYALVHIGFDVCADDPPDPDFKAIFVPTVPRLPRLRAGNQLTPKAARALRRMTANQIRCGAYTIAWIRSIEKAQGAAQANDTQWARRHRVAAAKYARTAAAALERDHRLRSNARRELRRGGFRHFNITSAQARTWQRQIDTHGLPSQMENILREAKIDEKRRQALRHDLRQVDPKAVAQLGLFGELDDGRFQQANTAMVQAMRQSADSLSAGA